MSSVRSGKHMHRNARNNLPNRLEIPSNSLTPSSSAPSSLSPLIVPAPNSSNGSSATQQQQRLTTELITAMGKTTQQPQAEEDGCLFQNETIKSVAVPDGEDSVEINPEHFSDLERLGEGAGGTVTKKINVDPEPNIHRQILRELQFLRTCHSPNIVAYFGASLEDSNSSIAIYMEYCEGGSLDAIYKNVNKREGRIGEVILGKIGESVLKGLVYLYSKQIIHRDIKPSNILVTRRGEIKICDFGVSGKLVASMAETFLGTSYYMAPERIRGLPYKVSADVWSLGLTIMEVAQNKFPFPSILSPIELVAHIANMPAPTLDEDYEWSEELKDFLKICLEKDGELRPTPKQMLDHPFIQLSSQRRVNLKLWIKQVWEWED
ncbi:529_t:CDS:2 [Funneliformis geosporum]|uniref:13231_t:CDS:1 n=1 Tax=Funneliformis geosporum TaxID=1117311 RepID=A0A9W4SFC2_9GLOM|nr:13231_t:CDS:2 [Funneliformis geosporum]CAI2170449.1 529_t:CDS:2 [Funneliformis geosporum]